MMIRNRGRRRFLLCAGGALALPFLESLSSKARADVGGPPKRLVIMMYHQGTLVNQVGGGPVQSDAWTPTGTGTSFQLSEVLSPLESMKQKILVLSGLWNASCQWGHDAVRGLLASMPPHEDYTAVWPDTPSIDQIIGDHIATETPLFRRTLNLAVGNFKSGLLGALGDISYDSNLQPVERQVDPWQVHAELAPQIAPPPPPDEHTTADFLRLQRRSVLDVVLGELTSLSARLSAADRIRLEHHADSIRKLEQQLGAIGQKLAECSVPPEPTSSLPPPQGQGTPWQWAEISAIEQCEHEISAAMIDLTAMALACDLTRVASIQYTNGQDPKFPWLNLGLPHQGEEWHALVHSFRNDPAVRPLLNAGFKWHHGEFARLIQAMDQFDEGSGTLLDNSLAVFLSEFGDGGNHMTLNMPVVLAGGLGGAISMGRHEHFAPPGSQYALWSVWPASAGTKLGQVWTKVQNLFGLPGNFAGWPEYTPIDLS